jgi:hypothetical protein
LEREDGLNFCLLSLRLLSFVFLGSAIPARPKDKGKRQKKFCPTGSTSRQAASLWLEQEAPQKMHFLQSRPGNASTITCRLEA